MAQSTTGSFVGFSSFEQAQAHQAQHGGHVYVSDGVSRVLWFSPQWTPTAILVSHLTAGSGGVLNPMPGQVLAMSGPANPHVLGSLAHQNFDALVQFYRNHSQEALQQHHDDFHQRGQNFLSYGVNQMSDFDFRTSVIRAVYRHRFNKDLTSPGSAA